MRYSVEGRRERLTLVRDAGFSRVSFLSALSGTMVAYGASIVLLTLVAGVAARVRDRSTSLGSYDWERIGVGAAVALAVVLFLSYLFGGYVAGRMARRAGSLNGLLVFVLGVAVVGVVAAVVGTQTDQGQVVGGLRRAGIPTTGTEWSKIGSVAGFASLLAMILGSVVGGVLGERWHGKLLDRALDPDVGPEADARRAEAEARSRREATTSTRVPRHDETDDIDETDDTDDTDDTDGIRDRRRARRDEQSAVTTRARRRREHDPEHPEEHDGEHEPDEVDRVEDGHAEGAGHRVDDSATAREVDDRPAAPAADRDGAVGTRRRRR